MANASELLNFLKRDDDLSALTRQSQLGLARLVHGAYRYAPSQHRRLPARWSSSKPPVASCSCLLRCLQDELRIHLPAFLLHPQRHGSLPVGLGNVTAAARLLPGVRQPAS